MTASDTRAHHEVLPHHRHQSNKAKCPYGETTKIPSQNKSFSYNQLIFLGIYCYDRKLNARTIEVCYVCIHPKFFMAAANSQWSRRKLVFSSVFKTTCYKIPNETRVPLLSLLASYIGSFLSALASKAYRSLRVQDGLLSLYPLCM